MEQCGDATCRTRRSPAWPLPGLQGDGQPGSLKRGVLGRDWCYNGQPGSLKQGVLGRVRYYEKYLQVTPGWTSPQKEPQSSVFFANLSRGTPTEQRYWDKSKIYQNELMPSIMGAGLDQQLSEGIPSFQKTANNHLFPSLDNTADRR